MKVSAAIDFLDKKIRLPAIEFASSLYTY